MLHELTGGQIGRASDGPRVRRGLFGIPALLTLLVCFVVVPLTAWAEGQDAPTPARVTLPVVGEIELCLVCPSEVLEMERQLFTQISQQQETPCRRPILRGEPLPGSARQEMETLFLQRDEQMRQRMDLLRSDDGDLLSEYLRGDSPADDLVERTARLFADLVPVVSRAVTHEDACGVYLPTLELSQDVRDTLSALRVFKGLSILLRTWSEQGREDEALKHAQRPSRQGSQRGIVMTSSEEAGAQ